jgi:predicted RNase H-like nuclease (RuvC/YqgF family)
MNGYSEDLDSLLDSLEYEEFEEAVPSRRTSVRTPSRQSSFMPRQTTTAASQTQVQSATRNLDSKIETLSKAVQALETRTNSLSTAQDRQAALVRKEVTDRRRSTDATRSDLQQTKMLAVLLPLLNQDTTDATDDQGRPIKVLTQSQNQLTTLLPLLLLLPGYSSGGDGRGGGGLGGGDSTMMTLLLVLLLSRK